MIVIRRKEVVEILRHSLYLNLSVFPLRNQLLDEESEIARCWDLLSFLVIQKRRHRKEIYCIILLKYPFLFHAEIFLCSSTWHWGFFLVEEHIHSFLRDGNIKQESVNRKISVLQFIEQISLIVKHVDWNKILQRPFGQFLSSYIAISKEPKFQ